MNLTEEQQFQGERLHREILLLCEGWNPRPHLSVGEAENYVARECVQWLEQFQDLLWPNSRPFELLLIKHLILRMIEDDFKKHIILDDIRASIHMIIAQDEQHIKFLHLWRDEEPASKYETMLKIVKEGVNERYVKWLG